MKIFFLFVLFMVMILDVLILPEALAYLYVELQRVTGALNVAEPLVLVAGFAGYLLSWAICFICYEISFGGKNANTETGTSFSEAP